MKSVLLFTSFSFLWGSVLASFSGETHQEVLSQGTAPSLDNLNSGARPQNLPSAGRFVANLTECPNLAPRKTRPKSVHDLRPDDFSVVMALGDSLTAAWFAEGIQHPDVLASFAEWRGRSFAAGGDPGALTVPNLIRHYSPGLVGASVGRDLIPEVCYGPVCSPTGWNPEVDRFNAARSGALAQNLLHEAHDYLVPQVKKHEIPDDVFKYMSFQIGSNDLCQLCLAGESPEGTPIPGSPHAFESDVREALEYVRENIPNTVVNVVGVFKVSAIYNATKHHGDYCSKPVPVIPHYSLPCACAMSDGPVGDWQRSEMDKLQEKYNERLLKIVKHYQELKDPHFAVLWQPAVIPLQDYPIEGLSDVDCFHPSTLTHQRIAAGIWNRLTLDSTGRDVPFAWSEDVMLRCLEDDDRIQTATSWE